jgi:hypothetical protein
MLINDGSVSVWESSGGVAGDRDTERGAESFPGESMRSSGGFHDGYLGECHIALIEEALGPREDLDPWSRVMFALVQPEIKGYSVFDYVLARAMIRNAK